MKKLEIQIREKLLPALIGGRHGSDEMRQIYSLPARLGGLGLQIPSADSDMEYENSQLVTTADKFYI